jgi:hypothetical protein
MAWGYCQVFRQAQCKVYLDRRASPMAWASVAS